MKFAKSFLLILLALTLSSCHKAELDYTDFDEYMQDNYYLAETKENKRYILYYFSQNCSHCRDVKQEVLAFFQSYELTDFYILDISADSVRDVSRYDEFVGTPSLFFIADGEVIKEYVGNNEIREFLSESSEEELILDMLSLQSLDNTAEIINIIDNHYLIYYYNQDSDTDITNPFLDFAFSRGSNDVYFVNYDDAILTEPFLNFENGPILLEMSYGEIMNEYEGNDILSYINTLDNKPLNTYHVNQELEEEIKSRVLDYNSFSDRMIFDFDQALLVDNHLHYEYFYSPFCSNCGTVKEAILSFFYDTEVPFYIFDVSQTTGTVPEGLLGVPTLWVVDYNEVIETYVGSLEILEFLDAENN